MNMKGTVMMCAAMLFASGVFAGEPVRVLILTGENNHNWKQTTPEFKKILDDAGIFKVEVTDKPWAMTPADFDKYDVLVCNWNNFGKKGPTAAVWSAESRQAFWKFIEDGKGFVCIHAGGSIFYDWPEFQKLIGATWRGGTYHPAQLKFGLDIVDTAHPITKGLESFKVFDEAWQKTENTNPDRKVLVSGKVPVENNGTGKDEPYALVTEQGKGRCFTLILGHTLESIRSAEYGTLLARGTEWAATGKVTLPLQKGTPSVSK
jgi:uncharacterized protein